MKSSCLEHPQKALPSTNLRRLSFFAAKSFKPCDLHVDNIKNKNKYKNKEKHKSCNFTILLGRLNPCGDRHEFCLVARSHGHNPLCKIGSRLADEFVAGESVKNALSHWKLPSPIHHCFALAHGHVCDLTFHVIFLPYRIYVVTPLEVRRCLGLASNVCLH